MASAALVFHSTREMARALEPLVPRSRLVRAPFGIAPEFREEAADGRGDEQAERVLAPLERKPFLLHVGSEIPRKRLDVLFEVFARARAARPELRLVQQGARLSSEQRAHAERLGVGPFLLQPPKLDRATLAGLYRRASLVLFPSDAEGFGFPMLEALACGAPVLASDSRDAARGRRAGHGPRARRRRRRLVRRRARPPRRVAAGPAAGGACGPRALVHVGGARRDPRGRVPQPSLSATSN